MDMSGSYAQHEYAIDQLLAWIDLNGYVQTQPTTMRFSLLGLQRDRGNPQVEIVIPVAKRRHL